MSASFSSQSQSFFSTSDNQPVGVQPNARATITQGTVTVDSLNRILNQPAGTILTDFRVRNRYENDRHCYANGVTSPKGFQGNSVAVVQLAAPTTLWIADWTAMRLGDVPSIPEPDPPSNSGWFLLDQMFEAPDITAVANGQAAAYRISGTYVYVALSPNAQRPMTMVNFGRPPWLRDAFRRVLTANDTLRNLIGVGGF